MRNIYIISSDYHVPFHNKPLLKGMLELIQDLEPKLAGFYILGDFMDINSLSFHDKGKMPINSTISLEYEYYEGNKVLDQLDNVLGNKIKKYYLWGNHEDRAKRHFNTVDGRKLGWGTLSPTTQLNLKERKYIVKEDWKEDYFKLGKFLELSHGQFTNIHTAKKHLDVFKASCMFGHTHRVQSFMEGNMMSFNIGHMADENTPAFSYASRSMKKLHLNAFAIVTLDSKGYFYTNLVTCYNNRFYYNGKKYGV